MAKNGRMRWECDGPMGKGCYLRYAHPKTEKFDDCLPGKKTTFSDMDHIFEWCGRGLVLEWKGFPEEMPFNKEGKKTGQAIMWERLTRTRLLSVLCVAGDAETMEVTHVGRFSGGRWLDWVPATMKDVQAAIEFWVAWAEKHPLVIRNKPNKEP
jgi:hypothetical protein